VNETPEGLYTKYHIATRIDLTYHWSK